MNFFQNIQRRLLLNHPLIWNTRIVPVLLLAGGMNVLLFVFFYVAAKPMEYNASYVAGVSFLTLCSIIGVIVYLIYLLRFNYFKNFGLLRPMDFFFQFALLFLALGSITAWPFVPRMAAHMATSGRFSISEMRDDLEEAYLLAYSMEYTQTSAPYRKVTIQINDSLEYRSEDNVNNILQVPSEADIDKSQYVKLDRLEDGSFIGYERPYLICNYYAYDLYEPMGLNEKIYSSLPTALANREAGEARLNEIFQKYIRGYDGNIYQTSTTFEAHDYGPSDKTTVEPQGGQSMVCNKYRLDELGSDMSDIRGSLFSGTDWEIYVRVWFYLTFYASVLLVIFRYMTARTFLWTLLFTFLLFVFTVIFSIISDPGTEGILAIMLFYYLVFWGFALSIFFAKSRNVFQGIGLNLSFFCLQIFPLVFVTFLYSMNDHSIGEERLRAAEAIGTVLVVLSSLFIHSRLFYKWYSLPEE